MKCLQKFKGFPRRCQKPGGLTLSEPRGQKEEEIPSQELVAKLGPSAQSRSARPVPWPGQCPRRCPWIVWPRGLSATDLAPFYGNATPLIPRGTARPGLPLCYLLKKGPSSSQAWRLSKE